METKTSTSIIPGLPSDFFYQIIICEGGYSSIKQYSNYDEALKRFNQIKAQGDFDTLEMVLIATLEEVVKNGIDD